ASEARPRAPVLTQKHSGARLHLRREKGKSARSTCRLNSIFGEETEWHPRKSQLITMARSASKETLRLWIPLASLSVSQAALQLGSAVAGSPPTSLSVPVPTRVRAFLTPSKPAICPRQSPKFKSNSFSISVRLSQTETLFRLGHFQRTSA